MSYFTRRRARRAASVHNARTALISLPVVTWFPREYTEDAHRDIADVQATVKTARGYVRRSSAAGLLLRDADVWLTGWLDLWEHERIQPPHLSALYGRMIEHLTRVSERLSLVEDMEKRNVDTGRWPYGTE
ncbi:hypothetical protein [Amycolatopsis sp. NPDC051071]|uniref:hypothetical protein n=1 Tax=Amycolatopsis sp. NPDC051071 TaxID=3154637 RepID=UPI00341E646C